MQLQLIQELKDDAASAFLLIAWDLCPLSERDPTMRLLLMASLVQHNIMLPRGEIRSRVDLSPAFPVARFIVHTEVQPALSMTDGRRHYYFSFVLAVPFVT
jgi:hypothetical protein